MTPAEEARLRMRLAALEADKRLLDAIDLAKRLKAAQCQLREFQQKRIKEKGMHITIHPLRDNFIAPRYKTKGAAAFDLYLQDDLYLTPGEPFLTAAYALHTADFIRDWSNSATRPSRFTTFFMLPPCRSRLAADFVCDLNAVRAKAPGYDGLKDTVAPAELERLG